MVLLNIHRSIPRLGGILFVVFVIICFSLVVQKSDFIDRDVSFKSADNKSGKDISKQDIDSIDIRKKVEGLSISESSTEAREKHLEDMWNFVYTMQYKCSDIEEIGGIATNRDGFYPVCKEPKFWKLTNDKSNKKSRCLVYSFGVGNDFSFDDGVAAKGCEVHSFDPSSQYKDGLVRDSGVTFHKIGIYEYDTDKGPHGWKMRTLASIMKMLGHKERIIDILKVDIDADDGGGYEDLFMNNLIFSGLHNCVRQYSTEIHYIGPLSGPNNRYFRSQVIWEQLQYLNRHGYKIFQTTDNVRGDPKNTQLMRKKDILTKGIGMLWELSFINENALEKCPY